MNIRRLPTAVSLGLLTLSLSTSLYANEFSIEGGVDVSSRKSSGSDSNSVVAIDLTYYLTPLNSNVGPLAETAFLSQASSVRLDFVTDDLGSNSGPGFNTFEVSGQYVLSNNYVLTASYLYSDIESQASIDSDKFSLGVGKYLDSSTLVGLTYSQNDFSSNFTSPSTGCVFDSNGICQPIEATVINSRDQIISDRWQVDAKKVWQLGDRSHALAGFIAYESVENNLTSTIVSGPDSPFAPTSFSTDRSSKAAGIDYTYYPKNNLGLSFGYSYVDRKFGSSDQLDLGTRWFIRDNIALDAGYSRVNDAINVVNFGLSGRF